MKHTVLVELKCKEGAGESFLPTVLEALVETRAYEGAGEIQAYVDSDDPDHLMLWEKWDSRGSQESYLNWRIETGMFDAFDDILAEPPSFVHLTSAE